MSPFDGLGWTFAQASFIPVNILCYMAWQVNWSQAKFKRLLKNSVAADIGCPWRVVFALSGGERTHEILFHHVQKKCQLLPQFDPAPNLKLITVPSGGVTVFFA